MKQPFALLLNDIHCGVDNIEEFNKNWNEAIDICVRRGIDLIIIGGDLFQARASQPLSVLQTVQEALLLASENGLDVIISNGNHDKINQEYYYGYCNLYSSIKNVSVILCGRTIRSGNVSLHVLSYFPENGSASERIESIEIDDNRINILYCHEGIRGGLSKASEDELPSNIFKKFDKVLVGHYHDRKKVDDAEIYYIGSSRQHNYGEDEEKGYTILYEDGDTEFVKNQVNTRYFTIRCSPADVDRSIEKHKAIFTNPLYRIRLRLVVPKDYEADKSALLEKGFSKVEIINPEMEVTETTQENLSTKFDKDSINGAYNEFCAEENSDPELGLFYLNKI